VGALGLCPECTQRRTLDGHLAAFHDGPKAVLRRLRAQAAVQVYRRAPPQAMRKPPRKTHTVRAQAQAPTAVDGVPGLPADTVPA
jgi:hypothetical protein